jgi:hypothetical protein
MNTRKGYALTDGQVARRRALTSYLQPGPGYNRRVRDSLAFMEWAEDSEQVDNWLAEAESGVRP